MPQWSRARTERGGTSGGQEGREGEVPRRQRINPKLVSTGGRLAKPCGGGCVVGGGGCEKTVRGATLWHLRGWAQRTKRRLFGPSRPSEGRATAKNVQIACESCERAKAYSKLYHNRQGVYISGLIVASKQFPAKRGGKGAGGPSNCASGLQLAGVQPLGPPPANHNPRINKLPKKAPKKGAPPP
jgi:hypothetical protein